MSDHPDAIVDYVEIVEDNPPEGETEPVYRVRAKSDNGQTIWTTEQYGSKDWALAVAIDSGKRLK